MKLLKILFLLLLFPLIELFLLIVMGRIIGILPTLLWIVLAALIGSSLIRVQGMDKLRQMEVVLRHGGIPSGYLLESVLILVGGALLILPGFLSDIIGIMCMIPVLRRYVLSRLAVVLVG